MCGKYYYRLFGKSAQGAGTWHAWCEKYVGARAVTRKYTNRAAQHIHKPKLKSAIGGGVPARAEEGTRRRRRLARYFPHTHTGHDDALYRRIKCAVRVAVAGRLPSSFVLGAGRVGGERALVQPFCARRDARTAVVRGTPRDVHLSRRLALPISPPSAN